MKLKSILIVFLALITLAPLFDASAQRKNKYSNFKKKSKTVSRYRSPFNGWGRFQPYWYVGGAVHAGNYFGDLAPVSKAASTDVSFTRPGFGVYGGYRFHHSLAIRGGLSWVRLLGDDFSSDPTIETDFPRYARNLSFRNDIKEFQLGMEVYLLPNYGGPARRLPLNGYLFFGVAVFHHEPMGKVPDFDYQFDADGDNNYAVGTFNEMPQKGEWVKLRPLQTEGKAYSNFQFSVPVSVGLRTRLPGTPLNAGIEFGVRFLFTDYIDDVSGRNYVDLATLEANGGQLARVMSDRSTVPVSSQGEARDLSNLLIHNSNSHGYFTSGTVGSGTEDGIRGNPDNNDFIYVTSLKLTYVIDVLKRRRAKYR